MRRLGILELRASDVGWGEISQQLLGTKLGSLMSSKNAGHAAGKSAQPGNKASESKPETARLVSTGKPEGRGKPERVAKAGIDSLCATVDLWGA